MTQRATALIIILAIIILGGMGGFFAGVRRQMNLEQWTVGGRGFGLVFTWLLMAGEIYTIFAFLGASGWAYSRGGPVLYILAYLTLGYVVSFFILPDIWELGCKFGLHTQSDFFEKRYGNKYLAALVAGIGVVFIVPYLQLQLTGLGIIMQAASYEAISRTLAMSTAFAIVAVFVLSGGVRAVAWVSVVKDSLMLFSAICIGFWIPYRYFGGIGPMFKKLAQSNASHLTMPGSTSNLGHAWFVSTVLLTSLGAYMWPQNFASAFTARNSDTLRRNAMIMPLYTITLPLLFFVGFAAILVLPGLHNGDLCLLTMVRKAFPAWLLGVVGGAGALTAMVPAAILILTAATLFTKNFLRTLFKPSMTDDEVAKWAKAIVLVITGVALYFAVHSSSTLVALLLLAYAGIAQLFPGVIFGLYWKRVTTAGVLVGLVAGVTAASIFILSKHDPWFGLNAGFIALTLNAILTAGVSVMTPHQHSGFEVSQNLQADAPKELGKV